MDKAAKAAYWQVYAARRRAARALLPRPQPPEGVWKDVGEIHAISDDGRVWSYRYGRLLDGAISRDGYRKVSIGGKIKFIHRLVAELFVPGAGEQVRHINGDKMDNRALNLAWGTCRENIMDKWTHGRMPHGEAHHAAKVPLDAVPIIRASTEGNTALGRRYGVSKSAIYAIKVGKSYGWL